MILRGIAAALLLTVLVPLFFAGTVAALVWMGLVAGWKSVDLALDWLLGDAHVWKVTIRREPKGGAGK